MLNHYIGNKAVNKVWTSEHTHTVHVQNVIAEPGHFSTSRVVPLCHADTGNSLTATEDLEMHK